MFRQNKNQPAVSPAAPFSPADIDALFFPFLTHPSLLLAVSGGSDSMALLHLASLWVERHVNAPKLFVAHVDHGLRAASADDSAFVNQAAQMRSLPFFSLRWDGDKPSSGIQNGARGARYALLTDLARQQGIAALVVAHTLDDQAETVLMRLMRGSGLSGLAAMKASSEKNGLPLLRPFLGVTREKLREACRADDVTWRDDASNSDSRFLRPRLRALLPQLAAEGLDAARLTLFAKKAARADAALEVAVDLLWQGESLNLNSYRAAPDEIRLRALARGIMRMAPSNYSPGDVALEQLDVALCNEDAARRTLGGAIISVRQGVIGFEAENDPRSAKRP